MVFNLAIWDIAMWFAATSVTLLVTSEFLGPHLGRKNTLFEVKKLRTFAILSALAFVFIFGIRILTLVIK